MYKTNDEKFAANQGSDLVDVETLLSHSVFTEAERRRSRASSQTLEATATASASAAPTASPFSSSFRSSTDNS